MVRGGKKEAEKAAVEANPEAEERKRRKRVAFSNGIFSELPGKAFTALSPSAIVTKHHGRDILRKSQRKNRFLFSFPGLLAPISGGRMGELKDLGTKNPVLYLDFPQGQMKLFGTIIYPKNKYLTLQFSKGGKSVMCEDYFDNMIAFADAWWIGRKDENPDEARLEFPKELHEAHQEEFDFKGGSGAASGMKQAVVKSGFNFDERASPTADLEDDLSDGQNDLEDLPQVIPSRHSKRTAGKRYNFAEDSSGDDFVGNDVDTSGEDKQLGVEHVTSNYIAGKTENSRPVVFDIDNEDTAAITQNSPHVQQSTMLMAKSKELSHRNHSPLVQTTISTLFKKVSEKKAPRNARNPLRQKDEAPRRKRKAIEGRKAGSEIVAEQPEVEEDDIEEFSSASKDSEGSDEDWAG